MDDYIYNIYIKCIEKHGILPDPNDIIKSNDNLIILVTKFNNWYGKANDFARGDMRDQIGFNYVCNQNINTIINDNLYNLISSNEFIQHMLFKLSNENIGKCFPIINNIIINNTIPIINNPIINNDKIINYPIINEDTFIDLRL